MNEVSESEISWKEKMPSPTHREGGLDRAYGKTKYIDNTVKEEYRDRESG